MIHNKQDREPDSPTYNPEFFSSFLEIEKKYFWFRARNSAIASITNQAISGFLPGYRVLEAGCGTGNVLRLLNQVCKQGKVYGLDLYQEGYKQSSNNENIRFIQGDINNPPFASSFDLIGLFDVLEHISEDVQLLNTLHNSIKPEGKLLLTVPAHMSLWSYFDEASCHQRRYTIQEIQTKLHNSGYQIDYISEYFCFAFPFIWLGRRFAALRNKFKKNPEVNNFEMAKNELKIYPIINEILSWLFLSEKFFFTKQRKLPFGSSIIVLATKKGLNH